MVWLGLSLGFLAGVIVGYRGGRLDQHARHRYLKWRHAVRDVPITFRSAVRAIKAAAGYMIAMIILIGFAAWILWTSTGR